MLSQEEKKEIVDIINSGMSVDLISNELGISKEELQQYVNEFSKKEIQKANDSKKVDEPVVRSSIERDMPRVGRRKKDINKMQIIREKYKNIYCSQNNGVVNNLKIKEQEPTSQDIEFVNEMIAKIETMVEKLDNMKHKEKRECANEILQFLQLFYEAPCSLEQAERMSKLIAISDLNELKSSRLDNVDSRIRKARITVNKKLAELVESEAGKTDDCDTIRELEKKITYDMEKNDFSLSSLRLRIQSKLRVLQQQRASSNLINSISDGIKDITRALISDNADIDDIKQKIDSEVQGMLATRLSKGNFALNEDHYREQVFIKIRALLSERAEEFPIEDLSVAMDQFSKIYNKNFSMTLRSVTENFVARGKYSEAKDFCSKYIVRPSYDDEEPETSKSAKLVKRDVIGAEIGNMVVKQINEPTISDNEFMEMLESRMQSDRVSKTSINLGKTKNGTKKITLQDVWYEDQKMRR